MRRDVVLFIGLAAAVLLGGEALWAGFGHYLHGPVVAASGSLVGAVSMSLLIIGFRRARWRRPV